MPILRQTCLGLLFLLPSALIGASAPATSSDTLVVAVDNNSPPFAFEDRHHQPQGIYVDILRQLARQSGLSIQIKPTPWRRATQGLAHGKHAVAGLYKNAERERRYLFSEPIWQENIHLFTLPAATLNLQQLDQLRGLKLGVLAGWYYSDSLTALQRQGLVVLEEGESDAQNIVKLRAKRLDALLGVKDSIDYLQQDNPGLRVRDAGFLLGNKTYLALPFTLGNVMLLDRINRGLRQIRLDSVLSNDKLRQLRSQHARKGYVLESPANDTPAGQPPAP